MGNYDWKFSTIGGMTRVNIESGDDIRHLAELDEKLWTVLSCPVSGMEFDEKTLKYIDTDHDGHVHVDEVVAASKWLTSVINDADLLLKKEDTMPLSAFNAENEEGAKLLKSAKQILKNLGLKKDSISIADTSDSVAIFAKTGLNGDGIITEQSTDDEALKKTIAECVASVGGKADRSGLQGVDAELIEKFYGALDAYSAWKKTAADNKDAILPYGDDTAAVYDLVQSVKAKVADYFMRCKLAMFHAGTTNALDVSVTRIETISDKDLSGCADEISAYPLARVSDSKMLPIDGRLNPVWQATFDKLNKLALDKEFGGAAEISEEQWNAFVAKLSAYEGWIGAKAGAEVEALGIDEVNALLKADQKAALLKLIDDDKALEQESTSIDAVDKLLHLYRDFYKLLCNFVSFKDFYDPDQKAIFQSGQLFIDERCCELCIKVPDMGPHNTQANLSGMFILYCDCVNKVSGAKMIIAAVMTNGDIADLRVGKHGVFYDWAGNIWDATVTKIIDNPISIRQAFWSPYRKLGKMVEDAINKFAADKDSKVMGDMSAKVAAPTEGKPAFDIAKFAGIFAAIGLALGAIGGAISALVEAGASLKAWQWPIVIVAILLVISGPAMIKAWLILRKRNLSPLLNANGWAINAGGKVNVTFGATLTQVAKTPLVSTKDPYADKKPWWRKVIDWLIIIGIIFVICWRTNLIYKVTGCLEVEKDKPAAVVTPAAEPVE
jgi:hypothetical protein